jgi:WD40 repeat protein
MTTAATPADEPSTAPPAFEAKATRAVHDWAHDSKLLCCRVDPTGRYVVAGALDSTIQRWEIATGAKSTLAGHENWVRTLGFSPDGATLYSGGYDGRLLVWETAADTPQPVRTIATGHGWLRGLAVSSDGQRLATCGNDRLVRVWSAADGQLLREHAGHPQIAYCVHFVPGSHDLVSGDVIGNVFHWRGDNGQLERQFDGAEIHNLIADLAPFGGIVNLAFSPDGKRLTACGLHKTTNAPAGNRRAVALSFDWATGEKYPKQESLTKELDGTMWRALYHPSGVMLGIVEKEIGFWKDGEEDAFHMAATPSEIYDLDFHPNQIDLFTAHYDGHVRSWRCAAG